MKMVVPGARHSFDEYACNNAAKYGHLEVLKYLHENGCPCTEAARNGKLNCLKYLHENGCPWSATFF